MYVCPSLQSRTAEERVYKSMQGILIGFLRQPDDHFFPYFNQSIIDSFIERAENRKIKFWCFIVEKRVYLPVEKLTFSDDS